jgi:hypothetical protein
MPLAIEYHADHPLLTIGNISGVWVVDGIDNVDMNVELTPDQRTFVQKAIESGRFRREEDALI